MTERIEAQAEDLQRARDELEKLTRTVSSLQKEIAERTHALDASFAGQQLLQAIVQSSDDAIISKTLDGIITSWNAGAEKLFGFSAQQAIGQPMQMLIPPDRLEEEPAILQLIGRGEYIDHFETVRLRADSQRIDISATISPIRDGRGKIIGASKIARDITGRKNQERKDHAQLARLSLLQQITRAIGERQDLPSIFQVVIATLEDHLPIDFGCICSYSPPDGHLTVSCIGPRSAKAAPSLSLPEQARIEIDGNGLSRCVRGQLVYEPDLTQSHYSFPQRLAQGGYRSLVVAPLLGESQVFGVLIAARRQAQGFSSGECEFLQQVTEHTALAAQQAYLYRALQTAYEDLRRTQLVVLQQERLRALGQMASGIAHDINNAISPAMIYAEMLIDKEANLSAQARNHLLVIQQSIGDVAETVSRMKDFYRESEPQLELVPVRLNTLAKQVVDLTRARWSDMALRTGTMIQVSTELDEDLPQVLGVESEIREALTNLVLNAVDAVSGGGSITLRTRVAEGVRGSAEEFSANRVYLEVVDTGIGMDESTRRRCLEPFFTTKGERGTGLGLAMVYGTAQRHGAEIEIDSAPGRGTTMRLCFSLPGADAGTTTQTDAPQRPSKLRILIVDDDPILLKALRDVLEADGHSVVAVDGGRLGVDAFLARHERAEQFSVVITDLGMPNVDGRKVAAAVKSASPHTPVILLTGWGQRLVVEGDVPPHVDRVLSKPPQIVQLRHALAQVTSGSRG